MTLTPGLPLKPGQVVVVHSHAGDSTWLVEEVTDYSYWLICLQPVPDVTWSYVGRRGTIDKHYLPDYVTVLDDQ